MTISALVDDKIFCVHGGLAEGIKSLDDVLIIFNYYNNEIFIAKNIIR